MKKTNKRNFKYQKMTTPTEKEILKEKIIKAGIPEVHYDKYPTFCELIYQLAQKETAKKVEKLLKEENRMKDKTFLAMFPAIFYLLGSINGVVVWWVQLFICMPLFFLLLWWFYYELLTKKEAEEK